MASQGQLSAAVARFKSKTALPFDNTTIEEVLAKHQQRESKALKTRLRDYDENERLMGAEAASHQYTSKDDEELSEELSSFRARRRRMTVAGIEVATASRVVPTLNTMNEEAAPSHIQPPARLAEELPPIEFFVDKCDAWTLCIKEHQRKQPVWYTDVVRKSMAREAHTLLRWIEEELNKVTLTLPIYGAICCGSHVALFCVADSQRYVVVVLRMKEPLPEKDEQLEGSVFFDHSLVGSQAYAKIMNTLDYDYTVLVGDASFFILKICFVTLAQYRKK